MKPTVFVLCAGLLLAAGCSKQETESETQSQPATAEPETQSQATSGEGDTMMAAAAIPQVPGDTVTTASGLKYIDVKVGEGATPVAGQVIAAHYTGWLVDGTQFDSSRDDAEPLRFPIGEGRVIKGWDEGLISMKVGGNRILIISPELGFAERGTPDGRIPPGATLIFDVELVEVQEAVPAP